MPSVRMPPPDSCTGASCWRRWPQRLAIPAAGGMRYLALIKLDKFATLERDVGVIASEEVLDRVREAAERNTAPERDRRPLRRREVPGAAGARQRARRRGLERAAAGAAAEARHARQRQVRRSDLHGRARRRPARARQTWTPSIADAIEACTQGHAARRQPGGRRPTAPTPTRACSPTTRSGSNTSRRR